jgi:hypothetical protein
MRWIARFAGWVSLFAVPCWAIMGPYQRALGGLTAAIVSVAGLNVEFTEVALVAPFDLAVYGALCLASANVSWRRRRRALLVGVPILIAGEVACAVLVICVFMMTYRVPEALQSSSRFTGHLLESIPWINASVLWLVLLGADELPALDVFHRGRSPRNKGAPS